MHFLFPATTKHLPNEDQLRLLLALLYKRKFPGFIHANALTLSTKTKHELNQYIYFTMTSEDLAGTLTDRSYLYIPFDKPKSYILQGLNNIIGVIMKPNLVTFWFEDPISIGELWTAEKNQIPIVVRFVNIGYGQKCQLCHGYGIVDWVDDIQATKEYGVTPKMRYVLANHRWVDFLIDNKYILDYSGEEIIAPCPRCLGMGCESVLLKDGVENKIAVVDFNENPMGYRLLIRDARDDLIETPRYY